MPRWRGREVIKHQQAFVKMGMSYSATGLVVTCDNYLFLLDSQRTGSQGRCFSLDHAGIEGVLGGE
jgi:hypothetical protein